MLLWLGLIGVAWAGDPEARRAFVEDIDAKSAGGGCRYWTEAPDHVVERDLCIDGALDAMVQAWTADCPTARDLGFETAVISAWDGLAECRTSDCSCTAVAALAPEERDAVNAHVDAAYAHAADGRPEAGLREVGKARKRMVATLGEDHPYVRISLLALEAGLLGLTSEPVAAVDPRQAVLAEYERLFGPDAVETIGARTDYGRALVVAGRYEQAAEELDRAAVAASLAWGKDSPDYATVEEALADAWMRLGRWYEASLAIHRSALVRQEHPEDPVRLGTNLVLRGDLLAATGNLLAALQMYDIAGQMFEGQQVPVDVHLRRRVGRAVTTGELASGAGGSGGVGMDLAEALADRIRYDGWTSPETADVFEAITRQNRRDGLVLKSGRTATLAWRIRHRRLGDDHPDTARALALRGSQDLVQGRVTKGVARLEAALAVQDATLPTLHRDRGETLSWLALGRQLRGETSDAVELLAQADHVGDADLDAVFDVSGEAGKRAWLVQRTNEMLRAVAMHVQYAPDDPEAARVAYQAVLSRKARFADGTLDDLLTLRDGGDPQGILADLAGSRADVARLVLGGPDSAVDWKPSEDLERMLRSGLIEGDLSTPDGRWKLALQDAIALVGDRETSAAQAAADRRPRSRAPSVEAVVEALPDDGALVEIVAWAGYTLDADATRAGLAFAGDVPDVPDRYARVMGMFPFLHPTTHFPTQWRYAAYVVRPDGSVAWADLGPVAETDALAATFRDAVRDCDACRGTKLTTSRATTVDTAAEARAAARALDAATWEKVAPLLGGAKRVFVAADGQLSLVPYEALVGPDGKERVREVTITMLGSGRDLLRAPRPSAPSSAPLVVADPAYGGGSGPSADLAMRSGEGLELDRLRAMSWQRLPGTRREAEAVAAVLPGATVLADAAATESAVKQASGPSILHVASHGWFLPPVATENPDDPEQDPLYRSGLVLAGADALHGDGAEDGLLTAAEVQGLDLRGTRLVVLSACETGTGAANPGQGVLGLRHAFLVAGAEAQVMSLWSVSDAATAELMAAYYRRLAAGEGRADALRAAKLELLDAGEWSHPYYWAAFVHSGAWGPLDEVR
jgi:tetratricopeptide (TPR) repeat protein